MKNKIFCASLLLSSILAGSAVAQDQGAYVQLNLGGSVSGKVDLDATLPPDRLRSELDFEQGFFGSVAAGTSAGGGVNIEGEVLYFGSDIETEEFDALLGTSLNASVKSYAAMVNVTYAFDVGAVSPYLGGGIGLGTSEYEFDGEAEEDPGLAWQLKAGVTLPVTDKVTVDVGYRLLALPSFETKDSGVSIEADGFAHLLSVGARFSF